MYISEVKALAEELVIGEQSSGNICPHCGGGSTKEGSFSVKRERISAHYICHRASCGIRGSVLMSENEVENIRRPRKSRFDVDRTMLGVTSVMINDEQMLYLTNEFGLEREDLKRVNWLWDNLHNRLYMPIWGPTKLYVGYVLRSFEKGIKRKALTVVTSQAIPSACFYRPSVPDKNDKLLVIVEDQISACKVSRHFNACALLGTHISENLIGLIEASGFTRISLLLDKDAFTKAVKYKKVYGELFDEFVVKQPERDLKYLTDERIKELVG